MTPDPRLDCSRYPDIPGESPKKYLKNGSLSNGERWRITCLEEIFVIAFTVRSAMSLKFGRSAKRLTGCSETFGSRGCWEIMSCWTDVLDGSSVDEFASLVDAVRSDPARTIPAMIPDVRTRNTMAIDEARMNIDST